MYYETVTRAVKAGFVYKKTIGTGDEFAKVIFRLGTAAVWVVGQFDCGRVSGLENRRSEAHIPGMATIVQCNCGAEYRRTEEKFLVPHTGDAVCTVCGAALKSWRESTHVPTYELIERPARKPE